MTTAARPSDALAPGVLGRAGDEVVETLRDLIRIPSVNPPPEPGDGELRAARYVASVLTDAGLHPEVVAERYHELPLLEEGIRESRLIGEVGLDGSPQHRGSWSRQIEVFGRALAGAQQGGGRVVSIHSRRAVADVLKAIEQYTTPDRVLPILHWFSGSVTQARKGIELGCCFSVNGHSLDSATGVAVVRSVPEDRLLTETDGPFTSAGDRASEPADVIATVERLAAARKITVPEMTAVLMSNAQRVFAFAGLNFNSGDRPRRGHSAG